MDSDKEAVDLDRILDSLGSFGPYQRKSYAWISILVVLASTHVFNYIFISSDVDYRCQVDGCDGSLGEDVEPLWLSNAIPVNEKCHMYAKIPSQNFSCLNKSSFRRDEWVPCEKYHFREKDSFIEEVGIACANWKRTLLGTLRGISAFITYPIVGYCSDRWGRKSVLIITGILDGIFGIIKSLSVSYTMYAIFETVESLFTIGIYSTSYVLALEMFIPRTRVRGTSSTSVIFASGQVVMVIVVWLISYWRTFIFCLYIPSIFIFVYCWVIDESPRWLLSKHKYKKVMKIITKISKTNKKDVPEVFMKPLRDKLDKKFDMEKQIKVEKPSPPHSLKDLLRSKILVLRLFNCSIWWFSCLFCAYGLSINSVSLSNNKYLGFLLAAIVEIPGHICGYLGMTNIGRKKTIMTGFLITAVCLLCFGFIPKDKMWLSVAAYLVGKFSIVMAIGSIYLYTSELFPTPYRLTTFTICAMIGRLGPILAPQTPLLLAFSKVVPAILFSSVSLLSAILLYWSPETLGMRLPETIEEATRINELKSTEITRL